MKKVTNKNTRRIAIALAMPAATISASAAETAAIVEELPEVSTETTVIANTDENIAVLEAVTTLADEIEEAVEEFSELSTLKSPHTYRSHQKNLQADR